MMPIRFLQSNRLEGPTDSAPDGAGTPSTAARATSATSPQTSVAVPPSKCDDPVIGDEVLGRRDLDADGVDKLFLKTGAGAYTDVGVFRIKSCEVVQVTMSGSPARNSQSAHPCSTSVAYKRAATRWSCTR
jgi:hypothetical protein